MPSEGFTESFQMDSLIRCPAVISLHLTAGQADRKPPSTSYESPMQPGCFSSERKWVSSWKREGPIRFLCSCPQTIHFPLLHLFISYKSTFKGSRQELCDSRTCILNMKTHSCSDSLRKQSKTPCHACLILTKTQSRHLLYQLLVKRALLEDVGK